MQKPVVGPSTRCPPDLLGTCLIWFAGLARRFAVLGFVFTGSLQAQGAPLDPLNHGGPFLGSLCTELVTCGEPVLVPGLPISVLAHVVFCACRTLRRRRRLRPVIPLDSTSRLIRAVCLPVARLIALEAQPFLGRFLARSYPSSHQLHLLLLDGSLALHEGLHDGQRRVSLRRELLLSREVALHNCIARKQFDEVLDRGIVI